MLRIILKISIIIFLIICVKHEAQQIEDVTAAGKLITANPDLLYNIVTIVDSGGKLSRGFLIGLKRDSLIINRSDTRYAVSLKEVTNISIEIERSYYRGLALGGVLGIYIGNLALFRAENQNNNYYEDSGAVPVILWSLLWGFVGGGIGYLVDKASTEEFENFSFADPESWTEEYERLLMFIRGEKHEKLIHVSAQLAQVASTISKLENYNDFYNYYITSFNMLRKLDLTYSFFKRVDLGGAISWFGEPSFFYYGYDYHTDLAGSIEQEYNGIGYYIISSYSPLKYELPKTLSWRIGGGIGLGNIDYTLRYGNESYTDVIINKSTFSGILFSNFDLNLYDGLSLGLAVDYVYIPETMPAIPELNIESSSFGNFGLGFAFSIHF